MQPSRTQVEAYFFGSPQCIGEKILFVKRDRRLAEYAAHLTDLKPFGNVWRGITGRLRGEPISVIATGIGPSLVGDAVYALDRPGAVCLYSGTCGGLHEGLEIGDYFAAEEAVCGDGCALHFGSVPYSTTHGDLDVVQALRAGLAGTGERFDSGTTLTVSSVVREADKDFWQTINSTCRVIEMRAAAFYAAAAVGGMRAAAYFWVTDLPTRGKSFYDSLPASDVQIKAVRYRRAISLDLTLLAAL